MNNYTHSVEPEHPQKVDWRRQLFNERAVGPIEQIQIPAVMITQLWGILLDIDPDLYLDSALSAGVHATPDQLFEQIIRPWLQRHPILRDAEVLNSGRGLHVVIWFASPVEFTTDGDRERWSGIVQTIQAVLPTDPDAPGITATTRECGSLNRKNGAVVQRLQAGRPVEIKAVEELSEQLRKRPFRTVMSILFGGNRCEPCPVCRSENTRLSALDLVGRCYGSCGKVQLAQLFDLFLKPRMTPKR